MVLYFTCIFFYQKANTIKYICVHAVEYCNIIIYCIGEVNFQHKLFLKAEMVGPKYDEREGNDNALVGIVPVITYLI